MQNNRLHCHQGHGLMVTSGRLKKQRLLARFAAVERLSTNVMFDPSSSASKLKILGVLCILVLCGILVAGLWPFHAPINDVTWLENADGVEFGSHGTLVSLRAFRPLSSEDEPFCSLEVSLQPRSLDDSSTILAFFTPEPGIQLSLDQFGLDMALQGRSQNSNSRARGARTGVYVRDVFLRRELLLIAIASGVAGTSIYVDGVLLGAIPQFRLSTGDCSGQLVLGTSPVVNRSWSGQLRELAIYSQELTADQVSRHFESWTAKKRFDVGQDEHVAAFYLFDEHQGRTVHDSSGSEINLAIPERFLIVHEKFLEPPWQEFHNDWGYWKNVLINIGGFIPLGFLFYAYLAMSKRSSLPALTTVILGAAVSLTIEVLQAYLPTRDSGMTDIITNTLGSGFGVMLYRWKAGLVMDILHRIAS
jgi:VanZ like family/Concanavalin A-like lectin/glucanases superfamily